MPSTAAQARWLTAIWDLLFAELIVEGDDFTQTLRKIAAVVNCVCGPFAAGYGAYWCYLAFTNNEGSGTGAGIQGVLTVLIMAVLFGNYFLVRRWKHVSDLHIDLVGLRVERSGKVIRLTAQEFRLLRYMAESAGCVLSRGQLLEHVWGVRHDPGTNVVDVYISYLRKKIDRGFTRRLVHTVRGLGYVLEDRA